jgi:hypothetical protein
VYIFIISRSVLLKIRNVSYKRFRENQNIYLCSVNFFFENYAVYEVILKKYGRTRQAIDGNVIRRVRITCWITLETHTENM